MRIRKIEEGLGVPLVQRGNRFQGFTTEGATVLRHAMKIMDGLKTMEQDIRSAQGDISGALSVGVIPTAVNHAAQVVKHLHGQHPNIRVTLQTATSLAIQQGIENGRFDAGFTYAEGLASELLRIDLLYQEGYLLFAPKHLVPMHEGSITWAQAAEVPLSLLEPEMQNRRIIDKVFSDLGMVPKVITQSSGFLTCVVLAREGVTATIMPGQIADIFAHIDGVLTLQLVEPELEKPVGLISRARDLNLPSVEALRAACLEFQ